MFKNKALGSMLSSIRITEELETFIAETSKRLNMQRTELVRRILERGAIEFYGYDGEAVHFDAKKITAALIEQSKKMLFVFF